MAAPIPAILNLIVEIRERAQTGPLSEIENAKFEKAARLLIDNNLNPGDGYAALGILSCLRGDIEGMHTFHKKSLAASANSGMQLHNYACSLYVCELFAESVEKARQAWEINRENLLVLEHYVLCLYDAGMMEDMEERLAEYHELAKKRHPIEDALDQEEAEDLTAAAEAMDEYSTSGGVSWDDLKRQIGL